MLNRISSNGCKIIQGSCENLHTSGHAYMDELIELIKLIKPKIFVPMHGEIMSLNYHSQLALNECGVKETVVLRNGQVLRLDTSNSETNLSIIMGELNIRNFYSSGKEDTELFDELFINEKNELSNKGIIFISIELFYNPIDFEEVDYKTAIFFSSRGLWLDRGRLYKIIHLTISHILCRCRPSISYLALENIITETIKYLCFKINRIVPQIILFLNCYKN